MSVVARIGGGGRIGPFPSRSAVRTCLNPHPAVSRSRLIRDARFLEAGRRIPGCNCRPRSERESAVRSPTGPRQSPSTSTDCPSPTAAWGRGRALTAVSVTFAAPEAPLPDRSDTSFSRSRPTLRSAASRAASGIHIGETLRPAPSDDPEAHRRFRVVIDGEPPIGGLPRVDRPAADSTSRSGPGGPRLGDVQRALPGF